MSIVFTPSARAAPATHRLPRRRTNLPHVDVKNHLAAASLGAKVRRMDACSTDPLAKRRCIPCEGGIPKLEAGDAATLLRQLSGEWSIVEGHHLHRDYRFPDFVTALAFVNRVGALAEENGHHPDLFLAWGKVGVTVLTHAVDGLTESDFILAAKIDALGE